MIPLPSGLDGLLRALRLNGLSIGAREFVRLREAFSRAPALDQDREEASQLRDLLAAALVHSPEERQLFDPVFEAWAKRWRKWEQQDIQAAEPPLERRGLLGSPRQAGPPRRRLVRWNDRSRFAAVLLLIAALSVPSIFAGIWVVAGLLIPDETLQPSPTLTTLEIPPLPPAPSPAIPPSLDLLPPGPPPKTIRTWVPVITIEKTVFSLGTPQSFQLGVGALALLGALTVGVRHRRRRWTPEVNAEPDLPGPERLPLLPLPDPGMVLLDPEGARTMVWGVSRYIAEEQTEDLDLDATVRSTAERAGIPELRYEPERPLREVWLWLDGTVEDPSLVRYCEEIAASLSESGLAVRLGGFDGDPQEVLWDEGQRVRPLELEVHRQTALVAICTDGAVLVRHARDARREPLFALLRMLAAWPHLTFVDFSRGAMDLARELRRFGIPCIPPEALPYFFGFGSASAPPPPTEDPGELRAWRAALALVSPRPVDRASAYAARLALRLRLSPWAFHRLTDTGPEAAMRLGDGLVWSPNARRSLLIWLAETELLDLSLAFWEERLEEEEKARAEREDVEAWAKHPARRHLLMERALLKLWRDPQSAAESLWQVHADALVDILGDRLSQFTPRDCAREGDSRIRLPWRLADIPDRTRYLFAEMGLGGVQKGRLRASGRLGVGLGLLTGLGLSLIGASLLSPSASDLRYDDPPSGSLGFVIPTKFDSQELLIFAGNPYYAGMSVVHPGEIAFVSWKETNLPCIEGDKEVQFWRCGRNPHSASSLPTALSTAIINFPTSNPEAASLAAALIDSGSVHSLLFGNSSSKYGHLAFPLVRPNSHFVFITDGQQEEPVTTIPNQIIVKTGNLTSLEQQLSLSDGSVPIQQIWKEQATITYFGVESRNSSEAILSFLIRNCSHQEAVHRATGMHFMRLCADGSRKNPNERGPFQAFWISKDRFSRSTQREAEAFCLSMEPGNGWVSGLPTKTERGYAADLLEERFDSFRCVLRKSRTMLQLEVSQP